MKKLILGMVALFTLCQVEAADLTWQTDLPKALAQAKAEKKLVLLDFTGSDWCVWCKKLDNDTFAKPQFATYAQTNLVLVEVDFPNNKPQSDDLKAANAALAKKYVVEGYPTLVALKPNGAAIWRTDGYLEGGPAALIAQIDGAQK
jgi:thioredoxin-related protein